MSFNMAFKYDQYCSNIGSFVNPKLCLMALIASGFSLPLNRAKIIDAGSPGISLGMIKFNVKAAKAAIR